MTSKDAARLQSLFAFALELPDDARADFLERECAGDQDLLRRLCGLLTVDARLAGMTARPVFAGLTQMLASAAAPSSLTGLRVGAFELQEELGRGGMGSVYRCERVDGSVIQEAAIKFVRRELLDANTLRRFQLERQLMATLDHPNIARMLDASELDDGTPYYIMEFVAGVPITGYCDRENLDVRERVALMRKVCGAVVEAHHELIVHRDLKPNNILVGEDGIPKLLDFGIAKSLGALPGAPAGEDTGTAQRYFSPHYAAPEQVMGAPVGIACDVYALGLLLYELLAGCRPFDFTQLSAGQIERLILEVPPAAPSVALLSAEAGGAAGRARQLRGDLDGVVLRCLRKAPHERYSSVEQLEADLGNYLDGLPVQARGGHGWYRLQKFILRNKAASAASLALALSLLVGLVGFAWQTRVARLRAAEFEQVSKSQAEMLGQLDPFHAGVLLTDIVRAKFEAELVKAGVPEAGRAAQVEAFAAQWRRVNATDAARELIDRSILVPAAEATNRQFKDQPVVAAALSQVLADRYIGMGLYDAALPPQRRALATRRRMLGNEHPDTLTSINRMGDLLSYQSKLREAEPYFREAMEKRRRILGEKHPDTLQSIANIGTLRRAQGKLSEAEPYYREALEKRRRVLGDAHADTLTSINNLGALLQALGRLSEAEPYYREALEKRRRVLGEEHAETLSSINNMGILFRAQGKLREAEPHYRDALKKRRRVLGEEHPDTLTSINNMGALLRAQGRLGEAASYYRGALEKRRRVLGEEHPETLTSINNLGALLRAQGRLGEAEPYYREALEKRRRVLGDEHPETLTSINNMGALLRAQGQPVEAEPYYREALDKRRRVLGNEHPETLTSINNMGALLRAEGKLGEAEPYYREALEKRRRRLGKEHPKTLLSINSLGLLLVMQGNHAQAAELLAPAEVATRRTFVGGNSRRLGSYLRSLGAARLGLREFAAAEANLLEAHAVLDHSPAASRTDRLDCIRSLVSLYAGWHEADPGKGHAADALVWQRELDEPGAGAPARTVR